MKENSKQTAQKCQDSICITDFIEEVVLAADGGVLKQLRNMRKLEVYKRADVTLDINLHLVSYIEIFAR